MARLQRLCENLYEKYTNNIGTIAISGFVCGAVATSIINKDHPRRWPLDWIPGGCIGAIAGIAAPITVTAVVTSGLAYAILETHAKITESLERIVENRERS